MISRGQSSDMGVIRDRVSKFTHEIKIEAEMINNKMQGTKHKLAE